MQLRTPTLAVASVWLLFLSVGAPAHTAAHEVRQSQPMPCPQIQATLDAVAQEAGSSTVIAVARLGDGETAQRLNARRLYNVRTYLTKRRGAPLLGDAQLVTATGEKTRGLGSVEIYLRGERYATFRVLMRKGPTRG
jgi:hypothetical protein